MLIGVTVGDNIVPNEFAQVDIELTCQKKVPMTHDPRTEPLREWNRLARENTENAVVSSMFEAALKASEPVETFSAWLLVEAASVASFFIANAENLIPFISRSGFVICGVFLCISCIFGLFSKVFALRCKSGSRPAMPCERHLGHT